MNKIILDSKDFSNINELHSVLKEKLQLPEYYGKNLDALWDCLTGWIELPMTIEWVGYESSKSILGDYAIKLLETFQDAEQEIEGFNLIIM